MRVIVDYDACEANGICEGISPEVFELDDDDNLHLLVQPGPELAAQMRRAVQSCPKAALSLQEGEEPES
jgi:ferredoxin